VSDEKCLVYKDDNNQKPVLSIDKIQLFSLKFGSTEPDCAKAIDFDYSIRITQLPYNFSLYPGLKRVRGELRVANGFSSHGLWFYGSESDEIVYFDCNFNPEEHPELCSNTELDQIICSGCKENPRENCPYPYSGGQYVNGVCCIYWKCPKSACLIAEEVPGMGDCGSGCTLAQDCDLTQCEWFPYHGACGMTYEYVLIPTGETKNVDVEEHVWEFGLSFGQTSFSPPKAKEWEVQLSLPITIKYNETFSTEGMIYIYAVQGELEQLNSLLEDTCTKALAKKNDINFVKQFHFSYPVQYNPSNNQLCMFSSCKYFDCPLVLDFEEIKTSGDYDLEFSFNQSTNKIAVRK
jgi:hypothetical protein